MLYRTAYALRHLANTTAFKDGGCGSMHLNIGHWLWGGGGGGGRGGGGGEWGGGRGGDVDGIFTGSARLTF